LDHGPRHCRASWLDLGGSASDRQQSAIF
jgi:hypothetical protein